MRTGTALAAKARKAVLEHATHQELPELPLDEPRQADPLTSLRGGAQEGLQMLADDLMEHGVLGVARTIHGLCTRHSPGVSRALRGANAQRWIRQAPAADAKNVGNERRHAHGA